MKVLFHNYIRKLSRCYYKTFGTISAPPKNSNRDGLLCKKRELPLKPLQRIQCRSVKYGAALIKGDGFCCGRSAVNFPVISRPDKQKYLLGYIQNKRREGLQGRPAHLKENCPVFSIHLEDILNTFR